MPKEYAIRSTATSKDIERPTPFDRWFLPGWRFDMNMIFDGGSEALRSFLRCNLDSMKSKEELEIAVEWYG